VIHPTAVVHPGAVIGKDTEIGPYCIVGEHVSIGDGTVLQAHVVANGWTEIGKECQIYPFATVGAASQDRKYSGERAYTTVGDRTILREYVSIQRATGNDEVTAVGSDCLILAYVHIAHNCVLGNGVTMSNLAQLAGHVEVGDYVTIGGHTGIHQFTRIGRHAMVGGLSKLTKDVPPFFLVAGDPCRPYGLNSVGLRRAAFSMPERNEIKQFYKLLYNPKLNVSQAIEAMKSEVATDPGREIIAFLEGPSERGVLK
jgi:UDP-N-acetylglucosamine acyltransferase